MKEKPHRGFKAKPFWDWVKLDGRHWMWTGHLQSGQWPRWHDTAGKRDTSAAMEAWRRTRGEPPGLILRFCDRRRCINPNHHDLMDAATEKYIAKEIGGCWIWLGRMQRSMPVWDNSVTREGVASTKRHTVTRMMWQADGRPLRDDQQLYRTCQNMRCVNPDHCSPLKPTETGAKFNLSPRYHHGCGLVQHFGSTNGRALLTPMQVEKIRVLWAKRVNTRAELAEMFGVDRNVIWGITTGRTYNRHEVKKGKTHRHGKRHQTT